ncbi:MFS transporter [Pseudonocardia spinosispora]|uniref:MFS transporter n=1 Tax=Pseudonocardia spinosispora TaxID=103441 RepID=UPI000425BCD3|nr:MFS transporter [Pseudonocardia spinosispora]
MLRRALILAVVLFSTFSFPLTITGASLAMPEIGTDLGADLAATQWVVNGYNACFAAFLVVTGSLADVLGRRRIFVVGLTLFCVTSAASALAHDILLLNVLRALGGIGAAAAVTGGGLILALTFEGAARTRAFSLLGTMIGTGLAFGPTISGLLMEWRGWPAVFGVPAALAAVALVAVPVLPIGRGEPGRSIDVTGAVVFTSALLLLIFALVEGPDLGFASPTVLVAFALVVLLVVAFPFVERRAEDPLLELRLLLDPGFLALSVATGAIVFVLIPLLVYLPTYLISVVGLGPGRAGVWMLMLTGPSVVLPSVGALLAKRLPKAVLVSGSVAVTGVGALLLMTIGPDSTASRLAVPLLLTGMGFGLSTGLLDGLAISSVRPEQSGMASGVFNTARLATETVGIAAVGALLAGLTGDRLVGAGFTTALHTVCLCLGVMAALATVCVLLLFRRSAGDIAPAGGVDRAGQHG